jgi:hypothetical protein
MKIGASGRPAIPLPPEAKNAGKTALLAGWRHRSARSIGKCPPVGLENCPIARQKTLDRPLAVS